MKKIVIFSLLLMAASLLPAEVQAGSLLDKEAAGEPPQVMKKLMFECNVTEPRVFVDDIQLKPLPLQNGFMLELRPGTYRVRVEKNGYQPITQTVRVERDVDSFQKFTLIESKPETALPGNIKKEIIILIMVLVLAGAITIGLFFIKRYSKRRVVGKFVLYKRLGKGGFATTFKAKDLSEKKIVALKVMDLSFIKDPDMVHKFFSEGEAISKINKKYPKAPVVKVFECSRDPEKSLGVPFISMELLKGDNLLNLLKKKDGSLSILRKLEIALEVAKALKAAHGCQIVHGDITPDNIIVDNRRVTLIDFGIALQKEDSFKNMDPSIVGKPVYMSPEQCAGEPLDEKSDVYSLGVILFFMFNGRPPFVSKNPHEIMRMHQDENEKPPVLDEKNIPGDIKKLVSRMLEKKTGDRPAIPEIIDRLSKSKENYHG